MPDWNKKFKAEYDYARTWLANESNFDKEWQPLIKRLYKLMSTEGFDAGYDSALSDLRKQVTCGDKGIIGHKTVTEDHGILKAVGAWADDANGVVEAKAKMRAAALKLLRHVYLLNRSGNRKVWVVSLPTELHDWPSDDLNARANTQIATRILLRSSSEIFNREAKKHLESSTQHALAWCQKTGIVLAEANKAASGGGGKKGVDSLNLVKRWFADPATSITDLSGYIATLTAGFKGIIAMLNKGHFVLTDWVPLRTASTASDISFLNSEAFTFRSNGEGMDVVYIEKSFFTDDPGGIVHGQKNWTRVVVHELTHLVCGTEDVNIGRARYAWYGIGPHAGFPGSAAIRNADSWAFFCADCAGILTESERKKALKII
ncbi:M35 family metallo-endopeptidase [Methylomicrobium sp. Wu6]|uniref:M35 family metallo-endopeptidase n=1 Tax=Methylomicrobium sp. Wu6 TaxID=3107928 RepID=UPI002DD64163|nr:M35 family metallo-endopeptidase [Methylomicrobium sp. Wu6]MEC4748738.1 M35 family metallo-endopeptidase [Methylomicrobium sp. Wu6]